jgi:dTDP-glucose 4,6-dehydratase
MSILVTGGLGFIGSHYVRLLVDQGEDVIVFDKLTYAGNKENLSGVDDTKLSLEIIDIADVFALTAGFSKYQKIETVVNFAAESHVDRSIANSQPFIESNIRGTTNLLDLLKNRVYKKLIQVSTDEVYGSITEGSWDENSLIQPRSPYSASKASADLLCLAYKNTFDLDLLISRCSNNYGPYQSMEKFIPTIIFSLMNNLKVPVYGNGLNRREWIHVKDHISAIYTLMKAESTKKTIYNIGGIEKNNLEIVLKIANFFGQNESCVEFVQDRKGHDQRYSLDFRAIRNEFLWEPIIELDIGLRETVNWYCNNLDWVSTSRLAANK